MDDLFCWVFFLYHLLIHDDLLRGLSRVHVASGIFSRSSLMYLTAMWLTLFGGIRSQLFRFIPESTSVNKVEVVRLRGLQGAI